MATVVKPPRTDDTGEIDRWRQTLAEQLNAILIALYGTDFAGTSGMFSTGTVTTQAATDVLATTATGHGNVTDLGTPNATQHGVCWNTSGTPTIYHSKTEEGVPSSTGAFSSSITGLTDGETYYLRAYITNALGTAYGSEVTFPAETGENVTWQGGEATWQGDEDVTW